MNLEFSSNILDEKFNAEEFNEKLRKLTDEILLEKHENPEKRIAISRQDRYNFACPYCGDSFSDSRKKRGNIYYKNYAYKCFNCGKITSVEAFLKDFGKSISTTETINIRNINKSIKEYGSYKSLDVSYFINKSFLEEYAIDKNIIFKAYSLTEITDPLNSWIKNYLDNRFQTNYDVFGWNRKYRKLFIFNLTEQNKVLGFQVRNFDGGVKYVTHTLEMIYRHLGVTVPKTDTFADVNKLSFIFGINTTDFSQMITITEGPLDAFLIKNGMSTCGISNKFPFEITNIRWFNDYDEDGINDAIKKIKNGHSVFLWKKYIEDNKLNIYKNRKLDYTELIKISKEEGINLLSIDNYFSNHKYDLYYIK